MAKFSRAKQLATRVAMMPRDTDPDGNISGGVLLSHIDLAGAMSARRACGPGVLGRLVTRAMDQIEFRQPVLVNDVITCYGKLTRVGTTSIGVHVEVEAERRGVIIPVTKADLVFVSVDKDHKPLAIPCGSKSRRKKSPVLTPATPVEPLSERYLAIRKRMMPYELNGMGHIFGGALLSYMDQAGSIVAQRACKSSFIDHVATRFMDKVEFKLPVHVNDVITCYGTLVHIGDTSLKVHVEVEADRAGTIIPVTSADLVYVAVDEQGKPTGVRCSASKPTTKCGA